MHQPLPARRSVRLATTNYVSGVYLVTIVTNGRKMSFGRIRDGVPSHTALGSLVESEIRAIPRHRTGVGVKEHVVMPNHVHMVVWLAHAREAHEIVDGTIEKDSLGSVVGGFKSGVTRIARQRGLVSRGERVWQRGFHESILRTERAVFDACRYVERNPELWRWDPMRDE